MDISASVAFSVTTLLFIILVGLIGWSVWQHQSAGSVPQPTWNTPEYLRFNVDGRMYET